LTEVGILNMHYIAEVRVIWWSDCMQQCSTHKRDCVVACRELDVVHGSTTVRNCWRWRRFCIRRLSDWRPVWLSVTGARACDTSFRVPLFTTIDINFGVWGHDGQGANFAKNLNVFPSFNNFCIQFIACRR